MSTFRIYPDHAPDSTVATFTGSEREAEYFCDTLEEQSPNGWRYTFEYAGEKA